MNLPREFNFAQHGWICPRCQGVMSPTHPVCFYCVPHKEECQHVWGNNLLLSDPPQKHCVKCGTTVVEKSLADTLQLCEHGMPVKFKGACKQCAN